jgi:hypothetical protein
MCGVCSANPLGGLDIAVEIGLDDRGSLAYSSDQSGTRHLAIFLKLEKTGYDLLLIVQSYYTLKFRSLTF